MDMIRGKRFIAAALAILFTFNIVDIGVTAKAEENDVKISLKPQYNADIVLTVGETAVDSTSFEKDLKAKLNELGIKDSRVNITGLKTQDISAEDTFAWDIYDHKGNWGEQQYPNGDGKLNQADNQHIIVKNSGKNIVFYGYGRPGFKDFMFMENDSKSKKTFEFELNESGINYHSMEGGGFLFNSKIENGKLSGYSIIFTEVDVKIYKIDNINAKDFHDSQYAQMSNYPGITLIGSAKKDSKKEHKIKIEANEESISMWDNGNKTIDNFALNTKYGQGFGPIASYTSHNCTELSYFEFNNLSMKTTNVTKFKDLLREPKWDVNSKRFVVNLNDTSDEDFKNPSAFAEIISRITSESIHYLGLGTDINKAEAEDLIKNSNEKGTYIENKDYDKAINEIADYIANELKQESLGETKIIVGQPMDIEVNPSDLKENTANEDFPLGGWKLDHNEKYYENNMGKATFDGQYMNNLDMIFEKTGEYNITFRDNIVTPKLVYAHRIPIANFVADVFKNEDKYTVSINESSYDEDSISQSDKGILEKEWSWKEVNSSEWTTGEIPSDLEIGKQYLIQLKVKDYDGAWSNPLVKYISTKEDATEKPIANFMLTPEVLYAPIMTTVSILNNSYDPQGQAITEEVWTVEKDGQVIYTGKTPKTDYTGLAEGKYIVSLKVKTSIWSEKYSREFQVKDTEGAIDEVIGDVEVGYQDGDNANSVTKDVKLPSIGTNNTLVRWSSDHSSINKYGKVTRPSFIEGDKVVNLKATLYNNGSNATKDFTVTVKALPNTAPNIKDGEKVGYINTATNFVGTDFTSNYTDVEGSPQKSIKIITLPTNGKLTYNGNIINVNDEIKTEDIKNLIFTANTDFIGKVELIYAATDGYDYSQNAKLVINIKDNVAPVASVVSIISNNSNDTTYAKVGDTITMSFTASKPLSETPKVTILGKEATVTVSNAETNSYTASYLVVDGDTQGTASFVLGKLKDNHNNELEETTKTTDGSFVIVDTIAPIVEGVEDTIYYKDDVFINYNEGEALLNGVKYENGTVIKDEGTYNIVVKDKSGNITTKTFIVDKTAPIVSNVKPGQTYKVDVTPKISDGIATLNGEAYTSGTPITQEGTHTIIVKDKAGNITTVTFTIDKSMPKTLNIKGNVSSEAGVVSNARLTLVDESGKIISSTVSDKNGNYKFDNEKVGIYKILVDKEGVSKSVNVDLTPVNVTDTDKIVDISLAEFKVTVTVEEPLVVGDGSETTTIKVNVVDSDGKPASGKVVTLDATHGTLLDGKTAITDENGNAILTIQSSKAIEDETQEVTITATVNGLGGVITNNTTMGFAPGAIIGVIIDNETGLPVKDAIIEVSKDFDNDGVIDFVGKVITGADGKYRIAIPKANHEYEVKVTKTMKIGNEDKLVTFKQKVHVNSVTEVENENYNASNTITGILLMKTSDGTEETIKDYSNYSMVVVDENGEAVTGVVGNNKLGEDGSFNFEGLERGKKYYANVYYNFASKVQRTASEKIKVGTYEINISNEGELNIDTYLIDPYGDITDKETGKLIQGANVKLYYANTQRNIEKGIKADTLVNLPEVSDFPPANNLNPQISDENGKYAWMVFPETDYYIVAKAEGYEDYLSDTISVENEIVRHDIGMKAIKNNVIIPEITIPEINLPGVTIPEIVIPEIVLPENTILDKVLPNTGSIYNNSILLLIGTILLWSGMLLYRKRKLNVRN